MSEEKVVLSSCSGELTLLLLGGDWFGGTLLTVGAGSPVGEEDPQFKNTTFYQWANLRAGCSSEGLIYENRLKLSFATGRG